MKRLIRILSVVSIFLSILFTLDVNAEAYSGYIYEGEKIDGIFYYKHREDTPDEEYEFHNFHKQATIYRRSTDNQFVYCIESWETLIGATNGAHQVSDKPSNLTTEQLNTIQKIAYYGYGYKDSKYDHTDSKWYAITQHMIWQVQAPNIEHYLVDSISSTTSTTRFNQEIAELSALVYEEKNPYMYNIPNNLFVGESRIVYDRNNVIDQYEVKARDNKVKLEKVDNNSFKITGLSAGYTGIQYSKTYSFYNQKPIFYLSDKFQDVMVPGDLDSKTRYISFEVIAGSLKVTIKGYDFKTKTYKAQSNIKVSLYNKDTNELITTKTSDSKGIIEVSDLPKGNYYYEVDGYDNKFFMDIEKHYEFTIDDKNRNVDEYLQLEVQKLKINIHTLKELMKIKTNRIEYYYEDFSDVTYGIYNDSNTLISKFTTDSEGKIQYSTCIPYGKYYIKEISNDNNYKLDENKYYFDFYKEDNEEYKEFNFEFIKLLSKGTINITKVDELTNNPLEGVKFIILNEDKNIIYTGITNSLGNITVELPYGKYYIKETGTLPDYILNEEEILLEIDTENINITLTNKQIIKEEIRYPNNDYVPIEVEVPHTNKYSYLNIFNIILFVTVSIIKRYA